MLQKAIDFATKKHAGVFRKDGVTPYVEHPKRIMNKLKSLGILDDNILSAAMLHDTVEDTETTLEEIQTEFNDQVMSYVAALTSDDNKLASIIKDQKTRFEQNDATCESLKYWPFYQTKLASATPEKCCKRVGKAMYLSNKLNNMHSNAKLLKLGDRLDNVSDRSGSAEFIRDYATETKYLLSQLDTSAFTDAHWALFNEISQVIEQELQ